MIGPPSVKPKVVSTDGGLTLSRKLGRGAATSRQIEDAFRAGLPVEGKVEKYAAEVCLLDQDYVKEPGKPVRQVVADAIAKLGENISVRRFMRFQLGEGIDQKQGDDGASQP